jgi:hypothetical protein
MYIKEEKQKFLALVYLDFLEGACIFVIFSNPSLLASPISTFTWLFIVVIHRKINPNAT